MAENDYLGNIQNQRLNQQWSNSMAWTTPSWMQTGFKQGREASTAKYQPVSMGIQPNYYRDAQMKMNPSMRATITPTVRGALAGGWSRGRGARSGTTGTTRTTGTTSRTAGRPTSSGTPPSSTAPTLPTTPLPAPSPTTPPYTGPSSPPPAPPTSPLPPPAPGVMPAGTPTVTPAFPPPGTPAPPPMSPAPLTPLQQRAVVGVAQNKAQPTSTTPLGQPSNPLPPMQRTPSVTATNRQPRTPSTPSAPTPLDPRRQAIADTFKRVREERQKSPAGTRSQKRATPSRIGKFGQNLIDNNLGNIPPTI
jgi:hypothetical protein